MRKIRNWLWSSDLSLLDIDDLKFIRSERNIEVIYATWKKRWLFCNRYSSVLKWNSTYDISTDMQAAILDLSILGPWRFSSSCFQTSANYPCADCVRWFVIRLLFRMRPRSISIVQQECAFTSSICCSAVSASNRFTSQVYKCLLHMFISIPVVLFNKCSHQGPHL